MDINQDFAYFKDTNGNAHSAGYVFNQNCIKNNQSGGGYMKDLVNSDLFDKLFENVCLKKKKKRREEIN